MNVSEGYLLKTVFLLQSLPKAISQKYDIITFAMKKISLVFFIVLFLLFTIVNSIKAKEEKISKENWVQLSNNIFIDKNSVVKEKYSTSAWFKVYASEDNNLGTINDNYVLYELVKYEAGCDSDVLALLHIKSFDINGNMIQDTKNSYNVFSGPSGVNNGEIYFNALCNIKKGK